MIARERGESDRDRAPTMSFEGGVAVREDDARVSAALEEYQSELKTGRAPSREEFLARHADIADSLAKCLDGLLLIHAAAPGLSIPEVQELLPPTTHLGDYRILREIGRGGMGVVYEAVQVSLDRRVALKVLPAAASPESRQRFQVEAQAAAHLHHPHIVPIFAVGCDRGVDYYTMQYIEGQTLSALIANLRKEAEGRQKSTCSTDSSWTLGSPPSPAPATTVLESSAAARSSGSHALSSSDPSHGRKEFYRAAARLGQQAAEALEHAHGLGVLHRDIKPSNLMIDTRGDLWVTDFGLARFRDDATLTRTGDVIGTLRYMSPEQALGNRVLIDQRVDLYSLGATLYELVTLRPLFEGHDRQALLSKVTFEDPVPPRKVDPSIPRDLETIILKAMAKDVSGRYASAREMADDFARFLDDRPVLARRPNVLDRASKWSRRHRTALTATVLLLVLGSALAFALLWRERQETLRALAVVEKNLERERQAVSKVFPVYDWIVMEAMGRLAMSDPSKGDEPGGFYRRAADAYEQIAGGYQTIPEMRLLAAEAYRRLGFVRMILRYVKKTKGFLDADAEGAYRQSIALCDQELAKSPGQTEALKMKAQVLFELADMLFQTRGVEVADPLYKESYTLGEKLVSAHARSADLIGFWSHYQQRYALYLSDRGRISESVRIFDELLARDPTNAEANNNLAWLLSSRPAEKVHAPARAVALMQKALKRSPTEAAYWNTLGMAQFRAGRFTEAENALAKSMSLHPPDPNDWLILAILEHRQGRSEAAQKHFKQAEEWFKSNPPQNADLRALRAEAAKTLGVAPTGAVRPPGPAP